MKLILLSISLLLFFLPVFGQNNNKSSTPDSTKIRSEINELEKIRLQLTDKIQKLKIACRLDSMGIVNLKNKKKDADHQTSLLKTGITDLENLKDKSREQKKLLKDLKKGHEELQEKFAALDSELRDIEINYRNTLVLVSDTEILIINLGNKLSELHKKRSP